MRLNPSQGSLLSITLINDVHTDMLKYILCIIYIITPGLARTHAPLQSLNSITFCSIFSSNLSRKYAYKNTHDTLRFPVTQTHLTSGELLSKMSKAFYQLTKARF